MSLIRTKEDYTKYINRISVIPYGLYGPTPDTLIENMVNQIDVDWKNANLKILNPGFGFGGFLFFVYLKLKQYHSDEHIINNMLYGIELEPFRFTLVQEKFKIKNLIKGDFLDDKIFKDMKFDVVIMNPPYLKRTWFKFVEKIVQLNPTIIATINPDPTNNKSDFGDKWREICIKRGLIYREDVTNYFPSVKSGHISAFILNNKKTAELNLLKSNDTMYESILSKVTINSSNSFVIRGKQEISGYGNKNKAYSLSDVQTSTHIHPCIMSCNNNGLTIKYSDKLAIYKKHKDKMKGSFVIMNRFFGRNNPDPIYVIDDLEKYNLSYDCLAFKLENNETIENFISVYSSKLYRYVMNTMRNGGFDITQSNFMRFRRLDLTKKWSDDEIYNELNLKPEEISHFE